MEDSAAGLLDADFAAVAISLALRAEGSFVAAAEAVGVTQPTLSAGIKELETTLGQVLVERGRWARC
jgi:DNA-binding transcriptional LysR family regulator